MAQVLYVGSTSYDMDEYAGSDPSGRVVAFAKNDKLTLLDTLNNTLVTLDADTRAAQASFQQLRSVSFSDDGAWLAYAKDDRNVTLRDLTTEHETTYTLEEPKLYRLRFAAGGRFLMLEVVVNDSNKNGKLQWLTPERTQRAPCPSPVPTYNVWQFPGDTPDTRLLDVQTGNMIAPQGFALAAGNVYVERTEDQALLVHEPGKPVRNVSSAECTGRVMHVDLVTGNLLFGCASAWGQRRNIFLRSTDSRIALNFDLAAYELDTRLPTAEPNIVLYPGNQTLVFNTRTRERWPLLDGTRVLTIDGTTALVEHSQKLRLIKLNPDASHSALTPPVTRPEYAGVVRQGTWVSVGNEVFHLARNVHAGAFATADTPLSLSTAGQGLYPARSASPTTLGMGPLRWVPPSVARQPL
jgi:WD40 repeat protein